MSEAPIRSIVLVIGTRPEVIKLAPVYHALRERGLPVSVCITGQHQELVPTMLALFTIEPTYNLNIGQPHQTLAHITSATIAGLSALCEQIQPTLVVVQGDTTSAFAAALACFYKKIPVAHVEAGLRTPTIESPFPEEFNRRAIGIVARYHFAPTAFAAAHLLREGVSHEALFCVGNTVVDALHYIKRKIDTGALVCSAWLINLFWQWKTAGAYCMLLTVHRRESFDGGLVTILKTIKRFVIEHPQVRIIFPVHPNPVVQQAVRDAGLHTVERIYICDPLAYHDTVYVLGMVKSVVTDSGGIQEEAVSLGKTVIVVRETTERREGVWEGLAWVVGIKGQQLYRALTAVLHESPRTSTSMVYGDGKAAQRIARIIEDIVVSNTYTHATQQKLLENI